MHHPPMSMSTVSIDCYLLPTYMGDGARVRVVTCELNLTIVKISEILRCYQSQVGPIVLLNFMGK